jgi:hypothetical protein
MPVLHCHALTVAHASQKLLDSRVYVPLDLVVLLATLQVNSIIIGRFMSNMMQIYMYSY